MIFYSFFFYFVFAGGRGGQRAEGGEAGLYHSGVHLPADHPAGVPETVLHGADLPGRAGCPGQAGRVDPAVGEGAGRQREGGV